MREIILIDRITRDLADLCEVPKNKETRDRLRDNVRFQIDLSAITDRRRVAIHRIIEAVLDFAGWEQD